MAQTIWFVENGFGKACPWTLGNGLVLVSRKLIQRQVWTVWLSLTSIWFERFGSSELVRGVLHSHHSSSFSFSCSPPSFLALFPFYTSIRFPFFSHVSVFPCFPYQSSCQSGWEKLDSMVWGMGLLGAGLHIKVLAAFSLVLLLYWVCPFLQAFCEVLSVRLFSATLLGH